MTQAHEVGPSSTRKGKGMGGRDGSRTKKNRAVPDKQGIFREELKSAHLMKWRVQNFSVVTHLYAEKLENGGEGCKNKERTPPPPFTC